MTKPCDAPKVFGAGLIALDLVVSSNPRSPIQSWAGGTCGNVLSILAYLGWDAFPIARMNGDPASDRVKADMERWGVRLDFSSCSPTTHTPIVIQEIRAKRDGSPTHRFSWSCPRCGQWLPGFRAITREVVEIVKPSLSGSSVFFMDRLSRATLTLAAQASDDGALVVFEPSASSDKKLFCEAIQIAHVVKYANQRMDSATDAMGNGSATLLEVQTLGSEGLRYRHRLSRNLSDWRHLNAVPAPRIADTCGSGDWCTAGLVSQVARNGREGFLCGGAAAIRQALRYGQALAAWNCGFEGARGGMYAVDSKALELQIELLLAGQNIEVDEPTEYGHEVVVSCPSCPSDGFTDEIAVNAIG